MGTDLQQRFLAGVLGQALVIQNAAGCTQKWRVRALSE